MAANETLIRALTDRFGDEKVKLNESMKEHISFRAGGPADIYIQASTADDVIEAVAVCRDQNEPFYILGNGSNMLVSDNGYRGVVIDMTGLDECKVEACEDADDTFVIRAGAGLKLSRLARTALENSLEGLSFAAGIPGTVGGACVMNAGAYNGEIKFVLSEVTVLDKEGQVMTLPAEDLELGYRHSNIPEKGYIVLSAAFVLKKGDAEAVKAEMDDFAQRRRDKQPLEHPSAGSTFKRPEGYFAGKLIQDADLKGFRIGGACVSEKHAGFVVNDKNGTASDVYAVIRHVQNTVKEVHGVDLETEVRFLGEF